MKARGRAGGAHPRPRRASWRTCWGGGPEVCSPTPPSGPKETVGALPHRHKHTPPLSSGRAGGGVGGGGTGAWGPLSHPGGDIWFLGSGAAAMASPRTLKTSIPRRPPQPRRRRRRSRREPLPPRPRAMEKLCARTPGAAGSGFEYPSKVTPPKEGAGALGRAPARAESQLREGTWAARRVTRAPATRARSLEADVARIRGSRSAPRRARRLPPRLARCSSALLSDLLRVHLGGGGRPASRGARAAGGPSPRPAGMRPGGARLRGRERRWGLERGVLCLASRRRALVPAALPRGGGHRAVRCPRPHAALRRPRAGSGHG